VQQYKLKNPFKVIFPANQNQKKSTRATCDARDKFNVCGKYIFRGKLTIQMLKRLKLLSLLKFPNIFHDVLFKSYF